MKPVLIILLTVWLLFPGGPAHAQERVLFHDEELTIIGDTGLQPESDYIRQIHPKTKAELEKTLEWAFLSKPVVLLTASRENFERLGGSRFVSALAIPSDHLVVLFISPATANPYILGDTYKHELCHLLLHDHIVKTDIPRWLDEGVCQWVSGTLGEILAGEAVPVSRLEIARRFIPLQRLSAFFPMDREGISLAYHESRDFVSYVTARFGVRGLVGILHEMEKGEPVESAFPKALSVSFHDLQTAWIEDMQRKSEWLIWASQNLYEILFFVAAVLAIAAFVRVKISRARYGYDDEEEE